MKTVCLECAIYKETECIHGEDKTEVRLDNNENPVSWHITLDRYQRDNLVWLFAAIGYPHGDQIAPFTFANNGDWVGEIPLKLIVPGRKPDDKIYKQANSWNDEKGDKANKTLDHLKEQIKCWLDKQRQVS